MSHDSLSAQKHKILVIDDHELILDGTLNVLKQQYPEAEILTAQTAREAIEQVENFQPDLVVMDLSIPETLGMTAQTNTGIQLLQKLMKQYPTLNLTVQSSYVNALVRLKHEIDAHQGGFTIADKSISEHEMLMRVNWALQRITHTKDLKKIGIEIKPEWLEVLKLAFEEGLQDRAIAKRMNVSERMVRHYWTKVQDVLEVYPEDDKNLRVLTLKRAREKGLLD
ncbi:MAG: response regulator transcription factor [Hydrococcus sp. C42_A2020_068]|uniref:response regulator n=1 Tax=Pleurocapsa sp. PCC 7327 TaxID=118163 RepID=UPI00029FD7CD|nr:response regulator transcription factor [Pleurocapsa sp. PCC 7327]AFY78184.1 response regulator containing a CheY-like receiver domain and an HTH DNA-binding domain [Pleurocapsa sp. PCC 7327]MBF2019982.1 response regulator transcription factor [Hydrococcus sp. C42_A2020_068]